VTLVPPFAVQSDQQHDLSDNVRVASMLSGGIMGNRQRIIQDFLLAVVVGAVAGVTAFLPGVFQTSQTPVVSCEGRTTETRCVTIGSEWSDQVIWSDERDEGQQNRFILL
jgi:hypothetical protein